MVSNHMSIKAWGEIAYSLTVMPLMFGNVNSNFTLHFVMNVITYPYCDEHNNININKPYK